MPLVFACFINFLFYSSSLSKIGVIFNSFAICVFVYVQAQNLNEYNKQ